MRKFIDHFLIVLIPLFLGILQFQFRDWYLHDFGVVVLDERQIARWVFVLAIAGYKTYTWIHPLKPKQKH